MLRSETNFKENSKWNVLLNCLRSEQGSALVLVMFIVLLLTILGISVLSATIGGAQRTETRENDVQSLHLAQKTIDEAIAYITADINNKIETSTDQTQAQFDQDIETFLNGLTSNIEAFVAGTELQGATNGIADFHVDNTTTSSKHIVTIKARATVNGVLRSLQQKIEITTFPDFLNYSLGSEGSVIINGAPYIQGDIYAGNQLKISPVAKYTHGIQLTQLSLYPLFEGEAHIQSLNDLLYSEDGNDYKPISAAVDSSPSTLDDRVKGIIGNAKIKKNTTFVQINVENSFLDKVTEASGDISKKKKYTDDYYGAVGPGSEETPTARGTRLIVSLQQPVGSIPILKMPLLEDFDSAGGIGLSGEQPAAGDLADPIPISDEEKQRLYDEAVQLLKQKFLNLSSSTIFTGSLELDGIAISQIRDSSKVVGGKQAHWFIVNGDLTIDNHKPQPIIIQSNILVTGNIYIEGKVEFDSTLYVLGKTDIVNATISGYGSKELVLLSKGPILINRVEEFKDEATKLRAFFYTDSTADLYGVGSIFSLDGGFFAKGDLTINAVVGKVKEKVGYTAFEFDSQTETATPRFNVNYNEQVFEDQNVGLPRVNQVNIHVGPIELLSPGG